MNRTQAQAIVRETFTAAFDKQRFLNLTRNLVNHLDESKAGAWNTQYVKEAFREHVARYERLGTYTSPEGETLDVLIVYLTRDSKLERARTAIRNFVADHLKTRDEKDAALVAFVSPSETQWRFSYVKMEYATTETLTGKVSLEARLTPARRFSYIVGAGEACHTAQTRFLELLQDTETDPTLAQIEDAFSVEAVTKEFFQRYVELFEEIAKHLDKLVEKDKSIRDEFKAKNISTVDFTKKLLGQIVFLYFVQKKGWLGVERGKDWGTGPREFMTRLVNHKYRRYQKLFNDILEPLFYEALAEKREGDWYERFQCRIPFLNGGLFEPIGNYDWRKSDLVIPNRLFTNDERVDEMISGTGVFDVFDRYNFTVSEAEPLEKEVAIDPEMLGRVFENLIEENRRKGLGAFYTPREIVHYMCQESLISYLDTALNTSEQAVIPEQPQQGRMFDAPDPQQKTLKLMAREELVPHAELETLVHLGEQISHYESVPTEYRVKMPKNIEQNARLIDEALANIAVCDPAVGSGAFPVGMMTEIVHARLALNPYLGDKNRWPYELKRHAIQNCLYGVDIDAGAVEIAKLRLWLSLVVDEEEVKQIKPLPNLDYKVVVGNSLLGLPFKSQKMGRIEELKQRVFDETDHDKKAKIKGQVEELLAEVFAASKKSLGYEVMFDFQVFFSEVFQRKGGFDVMIANPPYVRQEQIKEYKSMFQKQYTCYTGTADLYVYFYERAFQLLRARGVLTFISSNKYYRAAYGAKLRALLSTRMTIRQLIDFGDAPVFEAIAYPSIFIARKLNPDANETYVLTWQQGKPIERFDAVVHASSLLVPQDELTTDGWKLESHVVLLLLEQLRDAGKPLGEFVNGHIYRGIITGLNEAYLIGRDTKNRLIREDASSARVLKPFLRGRNVKRWQIRDGGEYLIKIESSENSLHPWSGKPEKEAEKIFAKTYPAVHGWLNQYRGALVKRDDQGKYFWELRSCAYWECFAKEKIIYPDIYEHQSFAIDTDGYYSGNTSYFIPTRERWLCGLLNSRVVEWFYSQVSNKVRGGYLRAFTDYMKQIPIPPATPSQQTAVAAVVDRILAAKKRDSEVDTSPLEREIDQLVYRLYGLTEEEIAIVEGRA